MLWYSNFNNVAVLVFVLYPNENYFILTRCCGRNANEMFFVIYQIRALSGNRSKRIIPCAYINCIRIRINLEYSQQKCQRRQNIFAGDVLTMKWCMLVVSGWLIGCVRSINGWVGWVSRMRSSRIGEKRWMKRAKGGREEERARGTESTYRKRQR